jgi:hypothetical protein
LVQFPSAGHCLRHFWGLFIFIFYFSFVELRRLVQLVRETIIDRNALLARHIKPLWRNSVQTEEDAKPKKGGSHDFERVFNGRSVLLRVYIVCAVNDA